MVIHDSIEPSSDGLYCITFENVMGMDEDEIINQMNQYGTVLSVRMLQNQSNLVFIRYKSEREALNALNYHCDGRFINLAPAFNRKLREPKSKASLKTTLANKRTNSDQSLIGMYIGNYCAEWDKERIAAVISPYGKPIDIRLHKENNKVHALFKLRSKEEADCVVKNLDSSRVDGRMLKVRISSKGSYKGLSKPVVPINDAASDVMDDIPELITAEEFKRRNGFSTQTVSINRETGVDLAPRRIWDDEPVDSIAEEQDMDEIPPLITAEEFKRSKGIPDIPNNEVADISSPDYTDEIPPLVTSDEFQRRKGVISTPTLYLNEETDTISPDYMDEVPPLVTVDEFKRCKKSNTPEALLDLSSGPASLDEIPELVPRDKFLGKTSPKFGTSRNAPHLSANESFPKIKSSSHSSASSVSSKSSNDSLSSIALVKKISSIVVHNFPFSHGEDYLLSLFGEYEPVAVEICGEETKSPVAVISFPDKFRRDAAILNLDKTKVGMNTISVKKLQL